MYGRSYQTLYPPIEPYAIHHCHVNTSHTLYVEESGNPNGIPVLVLHGGPGGQSKPYHRQYFDPQCYRIILFDQRGCGQSTPFGSLEHNSTADLLTDIESLRHTLHIDHWVLFGTSWGTTLALLYAQSHPDKVLGLLLRGVFLARERDMEWCYGEHGVAQLFPEQWQRFIHFLSPEQRNHPVAAYYNHIISEVPDIANPAMLQWLNWTGCVVSFGEFPLLDTLDEALWRATKLELHYMANSCFIEENQILHHMERLSHLPAIILHGQQDLMCPLENAYSLTAMWSQAVLRCVPRCGHLTNSPQMVSETVRATQALFNSLHTDASI